MFMIPTLKRLRQEDCHVFKASLGYTVHFKVQFGPRASTTLYLILLNLIIAPCDRDC